MSKSKSHSTTPHLYRSYPVIVEAKREQNGNWKVSFPTGEKKIISHSDFCKQFESVGVIAALFSRSRY